MRLSDQQWVFLQHVAALINYAYLKGYKLTGGELWRTKYQHQRNLATNKSRAKRSLHMDRLAIDMNLFVDGEVIHDKKHPAWQDLGDFWESLDEKNEWGGRWNSINDPYHFQRNR